MRSKTLRPSSWPIAGKLAFAFFFAALVPIFLTAYYGMKETLSRVSANERRGLNELADVTAVRLDETLRAADRTLKLLQQPGSVDALTGRRPVEPVGDAMWRLIASNDEIELLTLINRTGRVIAASSPQYLGYDVTNEVYFREALAGVSRATALGVDGNTRNLVLMIAQPIRNGAGGIVGVAAGRINVAVIESALLGARTRSTITPFLLDSDGGIAWHPEVRLRYQSVGPLSAEAAERVRRERRFGMDALTSANMPDLQKLIVDRLPSSDGEFFSRLSQSREAVALSPLRSVPLVVAVSEPMSAWEQPLREVFISVFGKVLAVTLIAAAVAYLMLSRDVIQPIRQLTRAAGAVKSGELSVRARLVNDDEVGDLAKTFNGMMDGIVERERERDVFGRVVSPEVREKLLSGQIKLGGENRRVTVLFSDIRSFTSICEGMTPEQVVEMLNEFLTEMTSAVAAHGGHVNNFLGDAMIVVFGAPEEHTDSAWAAVQSAFDMRGRLEALNLRRKQRGEVEIVSGIGIGTGDVIAGQMGSIERFIYTVVGDAVNVASRLEAMTKEFDGNPILINGETAAAIEGRAGVELTHIGKQALKGKQQEIDVYRVDWTLFD